LAAAEAAGARGEPGNGIPPFSRPAEGWAAGPCL
jgi:hypothetical protein